jgi:uncharacterized protein (TIGR00645 family)
MQIRKNIEHILERFIFGSRWLQLPLYLGLIVGGGLYAYKFLVELVDLCINIGSIPESELMLGILTLVDITMVANLLAMVIIGGYATFVSKLDLINHEDNPEWLKSIDAGTLKVKLAVSLVGVSGIHLLKVFINIEHQDLQHVMWQVIIHLVFLLSALALAYTDKILHSVHSKDIH